MTNGTHVKYSMTPHAYKFFSTHAHEISGWTIISILFHSCAPHLGGMNDDVKSDLATLAFNNRDQLEYFHRRIIRIQHKIILSGENVSPTRLLLQYMNSLSMSNKLKVFISPNMKYLITLIDNNIKYAIYTGGNINGIYHYLEMIGAPRTLTTSGQSSHHFGTSYSIKMIQNLSNKLLKIYA